MTMLKRIASLLLISLVAGCGGGGGAGTSLFGGGAGTGSSASSSSSTTTPTISVSLSSTTVTAAAPATVTATVQDTKGAAIPNQVVTFASTQGFGTFSSPSALTNASGQASVVLYPSSTTTVGADTVKASTVVNATAVSASVGFQLTPTNVSISSFASDVGTGTLAAYGQTTLTVVTSGAAAGSAVNVSLSSACVTAGKATLSATSASTTTGTATFAYQDKGCGATYAADTLQATVTGATTSTSLGIRIASPAASSVTFVSASPQTIYLRGAGFTETSTVTFKVVDIAGNPLPNQSLSMVATTYTGGLTLDGASTAVTKTSDANGLVTVIVNSGTVPTPVRVKATLVNSSITTSSSNLTITVGLPSQINFSLSQTAKNIEGGSIDGTPNSYKIIASDRMGNPVPAGTTVNFVSSGSQIVGSSQIALDANGNAQTSVTLLSSAPRPADGRITIVAYALGEESFIDANGTNTYALGDDFQDLGDVFVSSSFSSTFNPATDQRITYTLSAAPATCVNATAPKLQLDASVPSVASYNGAARCDGVWGQAYVRRAVQTVLSTSSARPVWPASPSVTNGVCRAIQLQNDSGTASYYPLDPAAVYGLGGAATGAFSIVVADANSVRLNPMAAGSTVTVGVTPGILAAVLGGSPVPSSLQATLASIGYAFTAPTTSGVITVNLRSPSGLVTTYSIAVTQSAGTPCP
jgi:hypothetical protein